jgi:hypothetical protein
MLRKIAIGLAAAVIAVGGSTLSASAMRGGGGSHGGGPHMGGGPGGQVKSFGPHGGARGYAMREHRRYWPGHDRYYRYGYSYGGSCWRWTPEGRVWVCDGGRSYRYGYYRRGWEGHRHGGFGPHGGFGHHGGRR